MMAVERTYGPTWRPSIPFRIGISFNLAPFSAVIGFVVWVSLPTGALPGWWFVVLAVPLWLWLVYRAWTLSATLTPDALIVRGLLSAQRIPLTGITAVGFSSDWRGPWASLSVTAQRRRHVIWAVQRNQYARPDRRLEADEAADAIRAAAALPRS
jgi:uncharacterized protein (DUF58 family)